MSTDVMDKIRRLKASRPQKRGGIMRGIFHQWKDGDNVVRLVGEFLEVRTHFIAPALKRQERGLCRNEAFEGDEAIPKVINCLDWDNGREEARRAKTCPICKLAQTAREVLKDQSISADERKFFEALRSSASPKTYLKWNILDRDDPFVMMTEDGKEKRVLGYKIASIGMEAWNDIEGIFEQCGFDIADTIKGIDIRVTKGNNGARVVYSAQALLQGTSLKVTPLSKEESLLVPHDLRNLCSKSTDGDDIMDALHEDLRELLTVNTEDKETATEQPDTTGQVTIADDEQAAIDSALVEDGDGLMDGGAAPVEEVAAPVVPAQAPVQATRVPVTATTRVVSAPSANAPRTVAPSVATAGAVRRPVSVITEAQKKR